MAAQRILLVAALVAAVALVLLIPRSLETSSGETDVAPIQLREDRQAQPERERRARPQPERRRERRRRPARPRATATPAAAGRDGSAGAAAGRDPAARRGPAAPAAHRR